MVSQSSLALAPSWSESMASTSRGLILMERELFFLSLHHGLSLHFCFFEAFLFLFSLLGLLFGLFLAKPLLLFLLLLGQFFLLLGSDLLALGLFFLEPLQFFLLLATLFAPFVDVFPQLFVEFTLLFLCLEESLALFGGLR